MSMSQNARVRMACGMVQECSSGITGIISPAPRGAAGSSPSGPEADVLGAAAHE